MRRVLGLVNSRMFQSLCALVPVLCAGASAVELYWTDPEAGIISRTRSSPVSVEHIVLGLHSPQGLYPHAEGNALYSAEQLEGKTQSSLMNGLALTALALGLDEPIGLDFAPSTGMLYFSTEGKIQRVPALGGIVEDIALGLGQPLGVALDETQGIVYWADFQTGKIQCAPWDGGPVTDLAIGLGAPYDLLLDPANNNLYWSDVNLGKIQRMSLRNQAVTDVVLGLDRPVGLAFDGAHSTLYWHTSGQIQRMALPGPNPVEPVVLDAGAPGGLALSNGTIIDQDGGLWVDFDAPFPWYGTLEFPFYRLMDAVDAANARSTIRIRAGVSSERPRIPRAVRLVAVGGPAKIGKIVRAAQAN